MCVIIHQPKNTHLDKETAERAWKKNPDGGGFAFINDDNEIELKKFMAFGEFWSAFEQARSTFTKRDFLVHFRIATHGDVNLANVHPFWVHGGQDNYNTVMAHNGIIHTMPDYKDGRSDTRVFVDEVLTALPAWWLDHEHLPAMVEDYVGWSKLAFLTVEPTLQENVYILNKKSGVEHEGMWFSNKTPLPVPKSYHTHSAGNYRFTPGSIEMATQRAVQQEVYHNGFWKESPAIIVPQTSETWDQTPLELEDEKEVVRGKAELVSLRISAGLHHRIVGDVDASDIEKWSWWCIGCMEEVDMTSGECDCFNKVCLDCERMSGECLCSEDGSTNLVWWDQVTPSLRERCIEGTYIN
jgi:predicted glutamine amidotransferase